MRPDPSIVPLRTLQTMAGLEWHPTSRWDWYLYGGDEYYSRASYVNATGLPVGYGSAVEQQLRLPSGIAYRGPAVPGANSQSVAGPARLLVSLLQRVSGDSRHRHVVFVHLPKHTWAGLDSMQPKGIENIVMTSFRYYFP